MMRSPIVRLLFGLLVAAFGGVAQAALAAAAPVTPATPIEHLISIMQSNHTFDSMFGTFPGAEGLKPGACMPTDPADPNNPDCVAPYHIEYNGADLDHTHETFLRQYRAGRMDGFVYAFRQRGEDGSTTMGHLEAADIPFYWNAAQEYVLFDHFFTSASAGSVPNRMFWVTGTAGVDTYDRASIPAAGWGTLPTIFDALQERGISWKFYVENYDPAKNFRARGTGGTYAQFNWVPLLSYGRYIDDPELSSHIVDLSQYYIDVKNNALPAVSYVVTVGSSDHPPSSVLAGQRLLKGMLTTLMQSPAWASSAMVLTYDDWGGWYDHVPPPQVDAFGYGFRTPALLISPYARKGYVDKTVLDFTSILKFIEENWGLPPLATRDANANSFSGAFDFTQAPREARILPMTLGRNELVIPKRSVIYGAYTAAVVLVALTIVGAVALGIRHERRERRAGIIHLLPRTGGDR